VSPGSAVNLTREVEAIQIPYGNPVKVPEGTEVVVVQELGGTFTVRTLQGFLLRVDGKDADALGIEAPPSPEHGVDVSGSCSEERIISVLKTCYDPEIPVNIVDLGLIYGFNCGPLDGDGSGCRIDVQMTLTAPGCGMGQVLKDDIERKLQELPGVEKAEVEVVFDPPWEPSRMTEAARLALGWL
jgi:probable FeS assembly SUF system protein SufT